MHYTVSKKDRNIRGRIQLTASKSISNRVLIIRALCQHDFKIENLAAAKDSDTLLALLQSKSRIKDVGPAGTTFRFLTAFLSLEKGTCILTGSERMKQRPIAPLVTALRSIGANISYEEKEGFPPLRIQGNPEMGQQNEVEMPANISSQFISALLLIAPALPKGLRLKLKGKVVSRPYILMTLRLMEQFGAKYTWLDDCIEVAPQSYQGKDFKVEGDWSAASYYYALAALSDETDLYLEGLHQNSSQGDSVLPKFMEALGVQTGFDEKGIHLSKKENKLETFDYNFINCPDIAQSLISTCAGLELKANLQGLETLKIKETDRLAAMAAELKKIGVQLNYENDSAQLKGDKLNQNASPLFHTYDDHRMAMALFPLALVLKEIQIEDPHVVVKSYPYFWKDMESLGFLIE